MSFTKEHPRACGENSISDAELLERLGTSPRMRGKQGHDEVVTMALRNIPAHAGKTQSMVEHDAGCGENSLGEVWGNPDLGTSPRMRGKLYHLRLNCV